MSWYSGSKIYQGRLSLGGARVWPGSFEIGGCGRGVLLDTEISRCYRVFVSFFFFFSISSSFYALSLFLTINDVMKH